MQLNDEVRVRIVAEAVNAGATIKQVEDLLVALKEPADDASKSTKKLGDEIGKTGDEANKSSSSFKSMAAAMGAGVVGAEAFMGALRTLKSATIDYAYEATKLSARYETLGISMYVVGQQAGYTRAEMDGYAKELQKTGISMEGSRQQMLRLTQAQIDLTQSSKLARIAQDAAVIGNINSTEAFERMIHGIVTGQTDVLRGIGLQISMENAYKNQALALGKTTDALTQQERMQGIVNAVMAEGAKISGTYESAMTTASKQVNSMTRYQEDLKLKLGEVGLETYTMIVMGLSGAYKAANDSASELARNKKLEEWGETITEIAAFAADSFMGVSWAFETVGDTIGYLIARTKTFFTGTREEYLALIRAGEEEGERIDRSTRLFRDALDARRKAKQQEHDDALNKSKRFAAEELMIQKALTGEQLKEARRAHAMLYGGDFAAEWRKNNRGMNDDGSKTSDPSSHKAAGKDEAEVLEAIRRRNEMVKRINEDAYTANVEDKVKKIEIQMRLDLQKEEDEYKRLRAKNNNVEALDKAHEAARLAILQKGTMAIEMENAKRLKNERTWLNLVNNIRAADYSNAVKIGSDMTAFLAKNNRAMFEVNKAFAIVDATISTYQAAAAAFKNGGGWPFGTIAAAITVAEGLAKVAAIRMTDFGGGGGAPPSSGGTAGSIPSSVGAQPAYQQQAAIVPPEQKAEAKKEPSVVNLYMKDGSYPLDSKWFRETLVPMFNDAVGDTVVINVRNMQ